MQASVETDRRRSTGRDRVNRENVSNTLVSDVTDTPPVLARELTDIPDHVRDVAAPPIPVLQSPYTIRVADPDRPDTAMITEWMNRPHLAAAWEYDWPVDRWYRHLRAQVDGTYSRPLIGSYKDTDMVYLEIYRAAKDSVGRLYPADPHDIGLHAAVAELSIVNKGAAARLVPALIRSIFEADPNCRRVIFEPDHRNTAMRRLAEFAGGVFLGERDMRADRRVALFVLPRTPDDLPVE